jgi:G3E family GTPase
MDLIALSGFFGAGKTTLLLQLARHFVLRERRRVYVVQNEIGEVGVDDQRLRAEGLELEALLGGCICCTLQAMLVPTLEKIAREHAPDLVILETSGMAQPPLLRELLRGAELNWERQQLWVLLDATRLTRLQRALAVPFVEIAVDSADVVVFTKVDVAGEATGQRMRAEALARNPHAVVVTTALRASPDLPELLRVLAENPPERAAAGGACSCGPPCHDHHAGGHGRDEGERGHGEGHGRDHSAGPAVCARQVLFSPPAAISAAAVEAALGGLRDAVAAGGAVEIGHLKLYLEGEDGSGCSWSVTRFGEDAFAAGPVPSSSIRAATLNAIVYGPASRLAEHVGAALDRLGSR